MKRFEITEIRPFMAALFTTDLFDHFLVVEGSVTTFCRYQIDGRMCPDFFDQSAKETMAPDPFVPWRILRERYFAIFKGKQPPLALSLTCKLSQADTSAFLLGNASASGDTGIESLIINIRYRPDSLSVTSGVSRSGFSLDKSTELIWDDTVEEFLQTHHLC